MPKWLLNLNDIFIMKRLLEKADFYVSFTILPPTEMLPKTA